MTKNEIVQLKEIEFKLRVVIHETTMGKEDLSIINNVYRQINNLLKGGENEKKSK
ncbi:MAG: hypothetical protein ACRC6E_14410 [Fusobacteriaceae bacterium]